MCVYVCVCVYVCMCVCVYVPHMQLACDSYRPEVADAKVVHEDVVDEDVLDGDVLEESRGRRRRTTGASGAHALPQVALCNVLTRLACQLTTP